MTPPAVREHQSPLEAALLDVHATLAALLVASDEQYAALAAHDAARLESVTRQQERLSSQLARAEAKRLGVLEGMPLASALASLPADQSARARSLSDAIAVTVTQLKGRQTHNASLLEQSIEVVGHTLNFLQRLVTVQSPAYGVRGVPQARQSLLVDSRA
jgi:flagellar biosynthesis/type III secretory pathway chaperone